MMNQPSKEHIAWAAGVFSGLGTFYYHNNTPALILSTADADLAERFDSVVDAGAIHTYPRYDHADYLWISTIPDDIRYVIDLFNDYLTAHLRRKASQLYAVQVSGRFKVICKHGHIRLPENLTKGNQCKPCIALRRSCDFYLKKNTAEPATIVE